MVDIKVCSLAWHRFGTNTWRSWLHPYVSPKFSRTTYLDKHDQQDINSRGFPNPFCSPHMQCPSVPHHWQSCTYVQENLAKGLPILGFASAGQKKYKRKNICQDDSSLSCGPMGEIKKSRWIIPGIHPEQSILFLRNLQRLRHSRMPCPLRTAIAPGAIPFDTTPRISATHQL